MRVGVDLISAGAGLGASSGGMIVYFRGLLPALAARPEVEELVAFIASGGPDLGLPAHPRLRYRVCDRLPRARPARVLYEQTGLPWLGHNEHVDVLFSTCNVRPFAWRGPSVLVLQSLQYCEFPEQFPGLRGAYLRTLVPLSARTATEVIAVSEWEREEAIRRFAIAPDRIHAVLHGYSTDVRAAREAAPVAFSTADAPYVVMVSSFYPHKNHERLVRAFARVLRRTDAPHRLRLAGGDSGVTRDDLAAVAAAEGIADRVEFLGAVPHEAVPTLLARADVVAYPSLSETFGHPILEGLAMGRPVVTSDAGAMREVAGDAAVLVDPLDVDSIAAGLERAMFDEPLRTSLAVAGPARAETFTWERCAEGTARVLNLAVSGRRGH